MLITERKRLDRFSNIKTPQQFMQLGREKSDFLNAKLSDTEKKCILGAVTENVRTKQQKGGFLEVSDDGSINLMFMKNQHPDNAEMAMGAFSFLLRKALDGNDAEWLFESMASELMTFNIGMAACFSTIGKKFAPEDGSPLRVPENDMRATAALITRLSNDEVSLRSLMDIMGKYGDFPSYDAVPMALKAFHGLKGLNRRENFEGLRIAKGVNDVESLLERMKRGIAIFHTQALPLGISEIDNKAMAWTGSPMIIFSPSQETGKVDAHLAEPGGLGSAMDYGCILSF